MVYERKEREILQGQIKGPAELPTKVLRAEKGAPDRQVKSFVTLTRTKTDQKIVILAYDLQCINKTVKEIEKANNHNRKGSISLLIMVLFKVI